MLTIVCREGTPVGSPIYIVQGATPPTAGHKVTITWDAGTTPIETAVWAVEITPTP